MTLLGSFDPAWSAHSERPAITQAETGEVITYRQLRERSIVYRDRLLSLQVGAGDNVAFFVHNDWRFFPLLTACAMSGTRLVPLNPEMHKNEIATVMDHCRPKLVLAPDANAERWLAPGSRCCLMSLSDFDMGTEAPGGSAVGTTSSADSVCLIMYTSGTTGSPKGVMLTQLNLVSMAEAFQKIYSLAPTDRLHAVLPLHHGNAVNVTGVMPLMVGAHTILGEPFGVRAKRYWDAIEKWEINICSFTPSVMAMLLKLFPSGLPRPLKVKYAFCGGAPLPSDLWRRFEAVFGIPVYQGYGLTETTFWVTCTPPIAARNQTSVGVVVDTAEIKIVPLPDANAVELQADRRARQEGSHGSERRRTGSIQSPLGEVRVRGPMLMAGYFRDARQTNLVTDPEGFLRTGDVGFFGADGELQICGRIKDTIKRRGVNIVPDDIDRVVGRHPDIAECRTLGDPDELHGERVVTVCVPRDMSQSADLPGRLKSWVRDQLSPDLQPDRFVVTAYVPRGAAGKVSTALLHRIVSGKLSSEIVAAITARKYCHHEPAQAANLLSLIQQAVIHGSTIRFVMLWGCGDRTELGEPDRLALHRLRELTAEAKVIPQVSTHLTLVFTEVHARLNGYSKEHRDRYLGSIAAEASKMSFSAVYESEVWQRHGVSDADVQARVSESAFESFWQAFELRDRFVEQAAKHSMSSDPAQAAKQYLAACQIERVKLQADFVDAIFLTYNGPEFNLCFPDLPTLYIYPHKRGTTVKPWFTGEA